jgi:SNF2 family DNA or RNA helicase
VLNDQGGYMSPKLQQVLNELDRLTTEERWQVIEYLMPQFQERFIDKEGSEKNMMQTTSQLSPEKRARAKRVLKSTRGSWGSKTLDEIDAELNRQRYEDWGE